MGRGCYSRPPLAHPRSSGVMFQAHGEGHEPGSNITEVRESRPITFTCYILGISKSSSNHLSFMVEKWEKTWSWFYSSAPHGWLREPIPCQYQSRKGGWPYAQTDCCYSNCLCFTKVNRNKKKKTSNIHISICITGHPGAFEKLVKYLVTYYIYRAISDIRGL